MCSPVSLNGPGWIVLEVDDLRLDDEERGTFVLTDCGSSDLMLGGWRVVLVVIADVAELRRRVTSAGSEMEEGMLLVLTYRRDSLVNRNDGFEVEVPSMLDCA